MAFSRSHFRLCLLCSMFWLGVLLKKCLDTSVSMTPVTLQPAKLEEAQHDLCWIWAMLGPLVFTLSVKAFDSCFVSAPGGGSNLGSFARPQTAVSSETPRFRVSGLRVI